MIKILRYLFYKFIIKPFVYLCIGINVLEPQNIPKEGPCFLISNHNSHLDTLVLMSLFPTSVMLNISPVAAADYFLKNKIIAWITLNIFNIIPISRNGSKSMNCDFNKMLAERISKNSIIILYPEGTRGEPEKLAEFKSGIFHIAKKFPQVPVVPCYIKGSAIVLPKDEILPVPAICRIKIAKKIPLCDNKEEFVLNLKDCYIKLMNEE